jgi:hypothetical protein
MKSQSLVVHVVGNSLSNQEFFDISSKTIAAFKRHGIRFVGEFICLTGRKIVSDPTRQIYGAYGDPAIWIFGLNPREWWGESLRDLLRDIEQETKIRTYSASN